MFKPPCRIVLQVCWNSWVEHDIVRGMHEYALSRPHWVIRHVGDPLPDAPWWHWAPAAAIVSALPARFRQQSWGRDLPLVALKAHPAADVVIERDDAAIGRLAARHLIEQGFRRLAFVPADGWPFSADREAGFREVAQAHELTVDIMPAHVGEIVDWEPDGALIPWLEALEKPCGIGCATDWLGRAVSDACRFCGIHVPDHVAIVGVDNDEPTCAFADPPLSSVAIPWRRVGFEAGRWVDRLLSGESPPVGRIVRLPPDGVVARRSTDVLAVSDPILRRAVAFIRSHACEGVSVKEVAAALHVDRRGLERAFRTHLDRSPHDELRRAQIEAAKRLLAETDMPLRAVCRAVGRSEACFCTCFVKTTGQTPGTFRAAHRRR